MHCPVVQSCLTENHFDLFRINPLAIFRRDNRMSMVYIRGTKGNQNFTQSSIHSRDFYNASLGHIQDT